MVHKIHKNIDINVKIYSRPLEIQIKFEQKAGKFPKSVIVVKRISPRKYVFPHNLDAGQRPS